MSRQDIALLLWENAYEAETSAILNQQRNQFVSKLIISQKLEPDTDENLGQPRSDMHQSTNLMSL